MKKWSTLFLAVLMCLSLCACGGNSTSGDVQGDNQTTTSSEDNAVAEQTEPVATESTAAPAQPSLEMSDDWADFTVSIDGTVYQFPCAVQTFLDDGWQPRLEWVLEDDYMVEPGQTANVDIYRKSDSETIFLLVYNQGNKACKFNECTVFGVQLSSSNNVAVEFSGGLKLGATVTAEDMLAMDEGFRNEGFGVVVYAITGKSYTFNIDTEGVLTVCRIETNR